MNVAALLFSALWLAANGRVLRQANSTIHVRVNANKSALEPVKALAAVDSSRVKQVPGGTTFRQFYDSYTLPRGIWKWSNALDAYQRHFAGLAGGPVALAEVGVQSGGSLLMWKSLLGPQCHVYGIDINPATTQFQDATTTITIGDQADVKMWQNFFSMTVKKNIDILVDDGGHEPHQMLVTLLQAFEHTNPNGVVAIEDIHGEHYVDSFFVPVANYLAGQAVWNTVDSVHVYPFLLVVQRASNGMPQKNAVQFSGSSATVSEFAALWAEIPKHPGGHVILENAGWGPFFTAQGLSNFFKVFAPLHGSSWYDTPTGCATTSASVCTNTVRPNHMQALVTGIHVYPTRLVVEVAAGPVSIQAVRRGSEWLPY